MRTWLTVLSLGWVCVTTAAQAPLDAIRALHPERTVAGIAVHCADLHRELAASTAELLRAAAGYYAEHFGVHETFALAVLDEADWVQVTSIPYGLPFVSGPPYVVVLPATGGHPLARMVAGAIADADLQARATLTDEEIIARFLSLIGFHELGHIYAKAYGLTFPNRWTFEFAATALAYAYLDARMPEAAALWTETGEALLRYANPTHTSLRDFESLYVGVGIEDYARYQAAFLLRAKDVHDAHGSGFLKRLRGQPWPAVSPSLYVEELDAIAPGFMQWAGDHTLMPPGIEAPAAAR